MDIKIIYKTSRNAVLEIVDGGIYNTKTSYDILLNGKVYTVSDKVINGLYDLIPNTVYTVTVKSDKETETLSFSTETESFTLNVRDFGAKGDGCSDDTCCIQAAIMACPLDGRVYIPKGEYRVTSIFLKSNLRLELGKDAVIKAFTEREKRPVIPGRLQSYDETKECYVGTWEGNPLTMFAAIVQGMDVQNVVIYGQGVIDGNAGKDNWWNDPKTKVTAWRPRLLFLSHCKNVVVEGITVKNSPSWTIHPYFSSELKFLNISIENPKASPNTDALDPESCKNVEITGVYFSVGDDCIAIKSGKIYMGRKFKTPSENITVRQCCMRDGHGSVTIGSENAGGVKNITIKDCLFLDTDRGLRIKTRRGRGEDAVIDNIHFENIRMEGVLTPFAVNSFYFCDPDGHTTYVQNREALPVDERTPYIKKLSFHNIECRNAHVAAIFILGLPERKIAEVEIKNVHISFEEEAEWGKPDMLDGIQKMRKQGIMVSNVEKLILENVTLLGYEGEAYTLENVVQKIEK